jgi:solute:Na+ symporter, SSS family
MNDRERFISDDYNTEQLLSIRKGASCYKISPMRSEFLIFFLAYVGLVLIVGLAVRRRMKGLEDFFLASRSLPGILVALSLTAGWFGATSILISTDESMRSGISAAWLVGLPAVATVLVLLALVRPLRRLSILTLPDLAEMRYGRGVRHLVSVLLVWYMALLAASQMVALGNFLRAFLGWPYMACLALGTGVVLAYSLAGGLRSVVATDVIQCALLTAGMIAVAVFLGGQNSPAASVRSAAGAGLSGYLDPFRNFGENGLIFLSFVLAWTISPIALQRIQAARSDGAARRGLTATAVSLTGLYALVVLVGIMSFPVYGGRALAAPLVSTLISERLGPVLGGLLFAAVLAAVLSTLDTALNAGALALTRDVWGQIRPMRGDHGARRGQIATVVMAVLALAVASRFQSILKTIGLASEILAEGFFIPGLAMILSTQRRPLAGWLGFGLGGGFAVASFLSASGLVALPLPVWPRSVPYGLALGAAGFAVGALIERKKRVRIAAG